MSHQNVSSRQGVIEVGQEEVPFLLSCALFYRTEIEVVLDDI